MSGKIVYGEYKIGDVIGRIVGWSTEEDLKISETGEVEEKVLNGETVQEIHSNHGWQAQGTVVVTAPEGFVARKGTVLSVEKNGEVKWFTVREWEESLDTDTGGVVASVTLEGRDSMQEEYQIGPRDPDTGEPLSNMTKRIVMNINRNNGEGPIDTAQGAKMGIFTDASAATQTVGVWSVDMSKAIATATLEGEQASFIVPVSVTSAFVAGVKGEIVILQNDFDQTGDWIPLTSELCNPDGEEASFTVYGEDVSDSSSST